MLDGPLMNSDDEESDDGLERSSWGLCSCAWRRPPAETGLVAGADDDLSRLGALGEAGRGGELGKMGEPRGDGDSTLAAGETSGLADGPQNQSNRSDSSTTLRTTDRQAYYSNS